MSATPRVPHACPVCHGQGLLSKPPWVPGDQTTWSSDGVYTYQCRVCDGSGIVWASDGETE